MKTLNLKFNDEKCLTSFYGINNYPYICPEFVSEYFKLNPIRHKEIKLKLSNKPFKESVKINVKKRITKIWIWHNKTQPYNGYRPIYERLSLVISRVMNHRSGNLYVKIEKA